MTNRDYTQYIEWLLNGLSILLIPVYLVVFAFWSCLKFLARFVGDVLRNTYGRWVGYFGKIVFIASMILLISLIGV